LTGRPQEKTAGASGPGERRDSFGYGLVIGSYLLFGISASLVTWADAPQSVLLVIRFSLATLVLLAVFVRRHPLRGILQPGRWQRLLLMGVLDAFTMIGYFYAVRAVGVAIATFFLFLQPVWVAIIAPRFLHTATERIVYLALAVALAGMALILWPSFTGGAVDLSVVGLVAALAAGWAFAFFQMIVKGLTREVSSITLVTVECLLDALFLLPLALWQFTAWGQGLTARDWTAAVVMGLVATALGYTMWMDGVARVRVQHSSILGLLTPVAAPVYALIFLGQGIDAWTIAGGALILLAAALVVVYGGGEPEPPL
jgi:drug/metabolite transporter (DMT)-like permease